MLLFPDNGRAGDFDIAFYGYIAIGVYMAMVVSIGRVPPPDVYILGWHLPFVVAILVAMADRVMDRLMARSAEIIAAGLDERASLTLLVRDHIEVALTDRDALAVYHREVRTLPEEERRRLSRAQRHYIEEWVHLLAPLRPDLADGEVRLAVHAAIGAIQSTLFFRSGLADSRLTELLEVMAHGCLGTAPSSSRRAK